MIELDAAPGIHRVHDALVNWYLVEDGGRLTAVDAGLPPSWESLQELLRRIGRSLDDIEALVLTHGHWDHVGFAHRLRSERGVPVWIHPRDVPVAANPRRYDKERSPLLYGWRPSSLRNVALLVKAGGLFAKGLKGDLRELPEEGVLDVPGRPRIVFTPGHTYGHCSLHLPDRDAVIAGDALVTLDPYTNAKGPRLVARAATADSAQARASLTGLAETGARIVLPGHGEPWKQGADLAAERARAAGIA